MRKLLLGFSSTIRFETQDIDLSTFLLISNHSILSSSVFNRLPKATGICLGVCTTGVTKESI